MTFMLGACGGGGASTPFDSVEGSPAGADVHTLEDYGDSGGADALDTDEESGVETDSAGAETDSADAETDSADTETTNRLVDYFDPGRVIEVSIAMAPADWDALRLQTRNLFDILGPGCLDGPPDKVFTWFPGDVTVDGVTVTRAGVRKKGFLGSLDTERPALRIEFDELVAGQRLGGLERMTLNNGRQDPSRVRQCLAYETFAAAGLAAPRCTFAHLTVNGADLGLYVHVEPVRRAFLAASFGAPVGEVWEGQLSDFREGWLATFEPDLSDDADPAPLEAVTAALAAPDDTLLAALDQVIDLDQFISFWATEVLIGHLDGYAGNANNYFVYFDPGDGRLRFVPWGTDNTFVTSPPDLPVSILATGALAHRLYAHPEGRARYHAELRRLLADVWDEAALLDRIAGWNALTWGAREPGSADAASADLAALRHFIQTRRGAIEEELAAPPDWPAPLRDPVCARPNGQVTGTFETTWGTLPIEALFTTGTGTLAVTGSSLPPFTLGPAGAKAGEDAANLPGRAQIIIAAPVVGAGLLAALVYTAMPIGPGELALDHDTTEVYVYYLETNATTLLGVLADGALVLEAADTTPGGQVRGSFTATLYSLF